MSPGSERSVPPCALAPPLALRGLRPRLHPTTLHHPNPPLRAPAPLRPSHPHPCDRHTLQPVDHGDIIPPTSTRRSSRGSIGGSLSRAQARELRQEPSEKICVRLANLRPIALQTKKSGSAFILQICVPSPFPPPRVSVSPCPPVSPSAVRLRQTTITEVVREVFVALHRACMTRPPFDQTARLAHLWVRLPSAGDTLDADLRKLHSEDRFAPRTVSCQVACQRV